jgi:iron complex transport system substrate-binding protein
MEEIMKRIWSAGFACVLAFNTNAAISVRDDAGDMVMLAQPARRVVSLAPHATELLFAAGGGERIVATVTYSDYPAAAKAIPRIGDNRQVDLERLVALKPDLLVVWRHNASSAQMEQLRKLGIPLFYSEPHTLEEVPEDILKLGQLMGTETTAKPAAEDLRRQLTRLAAQYRRRPPVRVFYQVWDRPLYTLNEHHIVTDAMRTCGGENIFAKLTAAAPQVGIEAVLQENPEVVISGDMRDQTAGGAELWKSYPGLLATRRGNLFSMDANVLSRPGPRIIGATAALCEKLELARSRRGAQP